MLDEQTVLKEAHNLAEGMWKTIQEISINAKNHGIKRERGHTWPGQ